MLAIAVSKHCTQDLPVVNTQGSSTGFLFTYHSAVPAEWLYTPINPHRSFIKHYINNLQDVYNILKVIDTILNKLFYKCSKRNDKEVYIVTGGHTIGFLTPCELRVSNEKSIINKSKEKKRKRQVCSSTKTIFD